MAERGLLGDASKPFPVDQSGPMLPVLSPTYPVDENSSEVTD